MTAIVNCDEVGSTKAVGVQSEPILKGTCAPYPETALIDKLYLFDFGDRDPLACSEREEVTLYRESA